jgi:hypothetical protein
MNIPTAIFAGLALIAAAIFFANGNLALSQVEAEGESSVSGFGPWNFKGIQADYAVWKLNSTTGEMHLCVIRNNANAESLCAKVPSE